MKKFIFTIFFVLLSFKSSIVLSAEDLKDICREKMTNPNVTIVVQFGDIKYDHTKSKKAISRIHLNNGGELKSSKLLNGLSVFERKIGVSVKVTHKKLPSGINCYYPTEVIFLIGTGEDPVIYIAREIEKDSCVYDVTLRHEQTHQQINQSVIEHYLPVIKEHLLNVVKKYPVAATKKNISVEQVSAELTKKYTLDSSSIIEEIKQETLKEQSRLDTMDHYIYDESLCR